MKLGTLLARHRPALVIGNGINRYRADGAERSWEDLLAGLARRCAYALSPRALEDLSLTEYYDLLDLRHGSAPRGLSLQKAFGEALRDWRPGDHHRAITAWAARHAAPILTSNFDHTLAQAGGCELRHLVRRGFTDFYPWESCFATAPVDDPAACFAIWHINGTGVYHRSIRLGLSHYMGAVQRARGWLHDNPDRIQHAGDSRRAWRGARSWLHVVFNRPLLFMGLALAANEVFLRWLLIERARYFQRYPARARPAWYLHAGENAASGRFAFLRGVGIEPLDLGSYDAIYADRAWRAAGGRRA